MVIWYALRFATASNLPNLFNDQKHKFQDHDTLKSPWLMPRSTLIENYPFLENSSSHNPFLLTKMVSAILWTITPFLTEEHFWAIPFLWTEITWTTLEPKEDPFSKQFSHEEWCFNLEGHLWHASLLGVDKSKKTKKNKRMKNWLSCHALENFD